MTDTDLSTHLKSVQMCLNGDRTPVANLVNQMLQTMRSKLTDRCATAAFWAELAAAAQRAGERQLTDFASTIHQQEPLGVITAERLRAQAAASGVSGTVTDAALTAAATAAGLNVCAEFEIPQVDAATPSPLKRDLDASFRSLVDVVALHEKGVVPSDIRVIDEFSAAMRDGARRPLVLADVTSSQKYATTLSDAATESAKKTLSAIAGKCTNDTDLRSLVLRWFVDLADDLVRKQGLMSLSALQRLTERSLADLDARRILAQLSGTKAGPDLGQVQEKIAAGDLTGARLLYNALTDGQPAGDQSDLMKAVTAALDTAIAQKNAAMDAYAVALRQRDPTRAGQALRDAMAIDREDAALAPLLEQLPPEPPVGLRAEFSSRDNSVLLTWRSHLNDSAQFVVVRGAGGAPANPDAGHVVGRGITRQSATDTAPPIAKPLGYAVYASTTGTNFSDPATATITVLPPPTQVETSVTATEATVFWRLPPEASAVRAELIDADGARRVLETAGNRAHISGLQLGRRYTVALTAFYMVSGRRTPSATVTTDITPRGTAAAVSDYAVSSVGLPNGKVGLRGSWTAVPGYPVDIWSLPIDTRLPIGATVTQDDLAELGGTRLLGTLHDSGTRHFMESHAINDVRLLVPITWDARTGLVGLGVAAGSAPPVTNVEAVRYGSELAVSWHWPHGDYDMDVAWSGPHIAGGHRRTNRLDYDARSGFRIVHAGGVTEVFVTTVAVGGGSEYVGATAAIHIDAAAATLEYTLKLPRGLFGGRTAVARLTTNDGFVGTAEIVAVLTPGNYMPARPDSGHEIARYTLDFAAGPVQQVEIPVPKIKSPYWLRLFPVAEGGFALADPPSASMKG